MRRGSSGLSCLLAIDKPSGPSSHDVVNRLRRILSERRVGHAGTLDPAATGVLVVGVGQATRLLGMLALDDKRYDARIAFGTSTDTDDAEGEAVREAAVPARLAQPAVARAALAALEGPCDQVPPAYSAISVDGRRAYDRARSGEKVELATRRVTIHETRLKAVEMGTPLIWDCSFHVSKGTYVRSIARDLGESLGTAAHLCELRRTSSGPIGLDHCTTLAELELLGTKGAVGRALDPVGALMLPRHELDAHELEAVAAGRRIACRPVVDPVSGTRLPRDGERVCLTSGQRLMGVWEVRGERLACVSNFPQGIMGVRS